MKQVTIRLDIRVSEEMNEFLLEEAHTKKMSFEGIILSYIEERMRKAAEQRKHSRPGA